MTNIRSFRGGFVAAVALATIHCGGVDDVVDDPATVTAPIYGGTFTTARPEVVEIMNSKGVCSGVMIGTRTFMTANSCIWPGLFQDRGGVVRVTSSISCNNGCTNGLSCDLNMGVCARDFPIDRVFPQGGRLSADDLAVGVLTQDVPSSLALPGFIAFSMPQVNTTNLTVMGYGCTKDIGNDGFIKRFATYFYNGSSTTRICSQGSNLGSDVGGPTFVGNLFDNGAIIRIGAGRNSNASDVGADPIRYRNQMYGLSGALTTQGISYRSHVQDNGYTAATSNGLVTGVTGKRLEGVQIWSATPNVRPCYRAHVQDQGWQQQVCDGELTGTVFSGKRMEALQITLPDRGPYTRVRYRANVQGVWKPFVTSDQFCSSSSQCGGNPCLNGTCAAGTTGQSLRIEKLEIRIE